MREEVKKVSLGVWFFWGIAVFCGFGVIAWILFRFAAPQQTFDEERAKARVEKLEALNKENDAKLDHYGWVAKDKGTVQIPIARAMELVANDLKSKAVGPSAVKVEQIYPYGLQPPPSAPAASAPQIGTNPSASPGPVAAPPSTNAPELKKP